jgi:hypothetical protein
MTPLDHGVSLPSPLLTRSEAEWRGGVGGGGLPFLTSVFFERGQRVPPHERRDMRGYWGIMEIPDVAALIRATVAARIDTLSVSATKSRAPKNEFVVSPQADLPSPVPFAKRIRFAFSPNQTYDSRVPPLHEGRFAIVTNARRDAMDANGAQDERARRVRQSQVVPMPRRWHQALRKHPQGDGDKKARSPGRAWNKP